MDRYSISPRIRHTRRISVLQIVMQFAWRAIKFASSNIRTNYSSAAQCSALIASSLNLGVSIQSRAISRTKREKGSRRMSSFSGSRKCHLRISSRARVPGRKRCGRSAGGDSLPCSSALGTFIAGAAPRRTALFLVLAMLWDLLFLYRFSQKKDEK